jgi:hypothetical protein
MLSSPFVLEGVNADLRPRSPMKSVVTFDMSCGELPLRPFMSRAASPFVSCESDSAL